jgi:hypothetical protein
MNSILQVSYLRFSECYMLDENTMHAPFDSDKIPKDNFCRSQHYSDLYSLGQSNKIVYYLVNIHEKFLNSDWLRAVQFFRNTVPKNKIQYKEKKHSANILIFIFHIS